MEEEENILLEVFRLQNILFKYFTPKCKNRYKWKLVRFQFGANLLLINIVQATPLGCRRRERGCRRVRPKSVAEQQCSSNEMLSLPPLHAEAADALAELPAHTLRHLVKGTP